MVSYMVTCMVLLFKLYKYIIFIMENIEVKYAVIPAAGRGTRFLPITKGVSKEMINIVDRPTIDYIVDECLNAGITNIVFIVSPYKNDIKKYYSEDKEFSDELKKNNKIEYQKIVDGIPKKATFYYVNQYEMKGLGDAVYQAKEVVGKNNFVVCCGDDIVDFNKDSAVKEMVEAFKRVGGKTIVGGQEVKREDIHKYGCMDIEKEVEKGIYSLKGIKEKPKTEEATSLFASLGKWVFNYKIFDEIKNTKPGVGGEIQLTDAIENLRAKEGAYFASFTPKRFDCGDKLSYLKAVIHFAFKNDEYKEELLKFIEEEKNNK